MAIIFVNNFSTFLGAGIAASTPGTTGFSITVAAGTGSAFPALASPDIAYLTVTEGNNIEIMQITNHVASSDTFTVTRGFEGTGTNAATAVAYTVAAIVECRLNKAALNVFGQRDYTETFTGAKTFTGGLTVNTNITNFASPVTMSSGLDINGGVFDIGTPTTASAVIRFDTSPFISSSIQLSSLNMNPASSPGAIHFYGRTVANRHMLKWVSPAGVDYIVQPSLFGNNAMLWKPSSAAVGTGTGFGGIWTATGTPSHPALSTTAPAIVNSQRRTRFTTATTANAGGGVYVANTATVQQSVWMGNGTGLGGFFFHARIVHLSATVTAGARLFVGVSALATAMMAVEPSAQNNTVGFGFDAADAATNYFVIGRGTALSKNACTTVTARATNNIFDVYIFSAPNSQTVTVRVDKIGTDGSNTIIHEQTFSGTNAPGNTVFMVPHVEIGCAAAARVEIIDISGIYLESDF